MIQSFGHTSFTAADLERVVAFWREVMGVTVVDLSPREGDWLGAVVGVRGARCRIAHLHGHGTPSNSSRRGGRRDGSAEPAWHGPRRFPISRR